MSNEAKILKKSTGETSGSNDDDSTNELNKNLKIYIAIAVTVVSLFIILAIGCAVFNSRRRHKMRKQLDESGELGRVYRPAGSGETLPAYPGGYNGGSYGNGGANAENHPVGGSELRDMGAPEVKEGQNP